ncbi:hypothetical protein BDQ12DRAFT_689295 [Crucibulum laeve]|uniref:Uncharacterized protein n=1 Tax=Crucibulum laeve TaxID=68775 RepID=A0A5C3LN75_9AGAR|nr:hypothetical protein BDQ12DRAFT_689295 [Crucibulum laeve]
MSTSSTTPAKKKASSLRLLTLNAPKMSRLQNTPQERPLKISALLQMNLAPALIQAIPHLKRNSSTSNSSSSLSASLSSWRLSEQDHQKGLMR